MKAGFWVAPEGEDAGVAILPIGDEFQATARPAAFLATASAEEMIARCHKTSELLPALADALDRQGVSGPTSLFDITDFPADDRVLIGEVLGEGEVAGIASLPGGVIAQIQEAVMAGLWRVRFTDADGVLVGDYIEVGPVPAAVHQALQTTAPVILHGDAPAGAMNVMPVLTEIKAYMNRYRPGAESRIINFSLLPMAPEDMGFLQQVLGSGPVRLTSRGYGSCRVMATGMRHVWSVQYFNAMDTIVLDTLEVGGIPVVVSAAEEDFRDSAERMREIEEAYFR